MVYLKTKLVKDIPYYYLVHSFRENGKHKKRERYIGRVLPENIEELKKNFIADLQKPSWLVLSKQEYDLIEANRNVKKPFTHEQLVDYSVNFTYNTQAIEEGSLTLDETKDLLIKDISASKPFKDQAESFSHKMVFLKMVQSKKPLSLSLITQWHKELFSSSQPSIAGHFRRVNVRVSVFKAPHYQDVEHLLHEFIDWYNSNKSKMHPLELAALAHLKFVLIHPFHDGNGRVSRLLLNYVLHMHGYPLMTIPYVDRINYWTSLDEHCETQEDEVFVKYIVNTYLKENCVQEVQVA